MAADPLVESGLTTMTRASALFAAGTVAGKLVGLVMLPVLTRTLTPSELGNLDVLMVLVNAVTSALLLGLDVAALRLYFDRPSRAAQRTLVATWYVMALGVTSSAGFVLIVISGVLAIALFSTDRLQPAVVATAFAIVAGTLQVIVLTLLRARGRAGWYAIINVGSLALYAVLATILLKAWRADAAAVVSAWAIALVVSASLGTIMLRRQVLGRPSWTAGQELLRLGLPLAPAVVGILVSEFLIRVFLLRSAGADQVAFFTVGNRFASVAALSLSVLQLAWVPRAYTLGTSPGARGRIGAEGVWIVACVCLAVLVVGTGARVVVEVVAGSTYLAALPALGFSLITVVGAAFYLVASMPSALARRTEDLAIATGAAALVAVVGAFLLAPTWGAAGTAAAVAVGQFIAIAVVGVLGARRLKIAMGWGRLLAMATATCAATLVLVGDSPLLLRVAAALLALAVIGWSIPLRQGLRAMRDILPR